MIGIQAFDGWLLTPTAKMGALRKSGVPTVCSFVCRQRPWRGRHQGCRIARKKLYFREIYACGGGLLVAPINAAYLLHLS